MQTKNNDGSYTLSGGLVRVEMKTTPTGKKVANFSLAIGLNQDEPKYANCVAWQKLADCICSYDKGDVVTVIGTIATRSYLNKDGEEKKVSEVTARAIMNGCQFKPSINYLQNVPMESTPNTFQNQNDYGTQGAIEVEEELPF